MFFEKQSERRAAFHGSSKPGKRSFGRFSRPLLEVYFSTEQQHKLKAKSLAVAESFRYCKGFSSFIQLFCVLYQKYKRGLLSAIFERHIRFKDNDGREYHEWEQKRLALCCNGFDNLRQPITANLRRKGKYPYYGANGIQDYVDDYIFDGEYILLAEDGGHFDEFASKPIAQFISGRVWVNNHAHIIQAKQGYNNKYIFYCLEHKDIRKYINGSSRAKLNQEDMWDIPIPVPCLCEQERIADFITAIDCSINDNVKQLETLQDLKTCLLQQLFI